MKVAKFRTRSSLKTNEGGSRTSVGLNVNRKVMCHRLEIVILPPSLIMLSMFLAVKITKKTC